MVKVREVLRGISLIVNHKIDLAEKIIALEKEQPPLFWARLADLKEIRLLLDELSNGD